jgi:arylsulfatase A-like enzyme
MSSIQQDSEPGTSLPTGQVELNDVDITPVVRITPATIVLVAVWIGLVAGFLDLGQVVLLILKNRLIDGQALYRLGRDFLWITPTGVSVIVFLPGLMLALIGTLRRRCLSLDVVVGVLSFVGFLEFSTRFPLSFWSALLICAGSATVSARFVRRHSHKFLTLCRVSTPVLVGAVILISLVTAGRAAWAERRSLASLPRPREAAKNVLLIVWDTVRSSNLSLNGYPRRTTPNLEALARRGIRFDHAFAAASWTLPSHASIFTGRWPYAHGADWKSPLDTTHRTLAEHLGSRGYDTAGFVANLDYCGRPTGLDRGFVHYEDYPITPLEVLTRYIGLGRKIDLISLGFLINKLGGHRGELTSEQPFSQEHVKRGDEIDKSFLDWLSWQQTRKRPFFAFLNYNDAHPPFEVPDLKAPAFGLRPSSWDDLRVMSNWFSQDKKRLTIRQVKMAIDIYDDSIGYLDRRLGVLLAELGRRGVLDDTLVIVTSDHGEHLGDHRLFFHGCSLYRQLVEVPLVIVNSTGLAAGRVVAEPVSLRAIPATIVDLLALDVERPFPGTPLTRFWTDDAAAAGSSVEPLLMEIGRPLYSANAGREPAAKGPMQALVASGKHYIRTADGLEELYELASDPEERFNLARTPNGLKALKGFRDRLPSLPKNR